MKLDLNLTGNLANDGEEFASALTGNRDFPEEYLHKNYAYSVRRADELSTHMVYDSKPKELLEIVRPYEFDAVKQYRLNSWQPVNYSTLKKPLNFISRIFNKNLMRLEVSEGESGVLKEGDSFREYLNDLPIHKSFESFMRTYLPSKIFSDPNGWLAMWPETFQYDAEGNELFDKSELPRVLPVYIPSKDVIFYCKDYLIAKSSDKSEVHLGDASKTQYLGDVFIAFTRYATFQIYQHGRKSDRLFAYRTIHDHNLGEIPATKFKGYVAHQQEQTLSESQADIVHDSFLQPAIPHLNDLVGSYSDYRAALVLHLHPQYYEADSPDEETGANDFFMKDADGNLYKKQGEEIEYVNRGPANVTKVQVSDDGRVYPHGGYIEGPIDIVKSMRDEIERLKVEALSSLNMAFLAREGKKSAETGESLREEKDPLIAFLENLSAEFKRVGDWVLDKTNKLRYGLVFEDGEQSAILISPERFTVKDINDASNSLKLVSETGSDKSLALQTHLEYAEKEFGSDSEQFKFLKTAFMLNPYFGHSMEDLADLLLSEVITKEDLLLSINIPKLLPLAIEREPKFLSLPIQEQREIIKELNGMDRRDS